MRRIVIMGSTGAGKTTVGKELFDILDIPFIELDSLFWLENWLSSPKDAFVKQVTMYANTDTWIMDGNYESVRKIIWSRADTLVWLDYPFHIILARLVKRIINRATTKEVLWGTNTDNGWVHLKLWSKDSLINWLFQTYWKRKKQMPIMIDNDGKHLNVIRITSQIELDEFILSIS